MNRLIMAELTRLVTTRFWVWALLAAGLCGALPTAGLALLGPENVDPPMPGLAEPDGVRAILGFISFFAFVPAALGTMAMTSEYRHQTITTTFLFAPRRWQVLTAKLLAYALAGAVYGLTVAVFAGLGLFGGAAGAGTTIGLPTGTVIELLLRIGAAMTVYMVIGVGVGALLVNQIAALAVVVGYLYMVEIVILAIPGVNTIYPYLPGGATAALTDFTYLGDAMAAETGGTAGELLPGHLGAVVLAGYALAASALAVALPLRRDVT